MILRIQSQHWLILHFLNQMTNIFKFLENNKIAYAVLEGAYDEKSLKEEDVVALQAILPRVIDQFQTYLRELRISDLRGSKGIYRLQTELLARVNAASPVEVRDVLFQEILIQ